jgi:crotonobetainyl-CoA:carnitine CoA-transferase CaiB-like acyl-CoA transferase
MDYQCLRKIKPDLIMLSSCLNGQTGPASMLAGYGNMGAVMAGFGELTGWPDRPPTAPYGAYTDYVSPFAITALLAAVDHKRPTGEGQYIDLSQAESSIHIIGRAILDYTVNERVQTRTGNALAEFAPNGVYPCAGIDSWVALAAPTDEVWRALCDASGQNWSGDLRFATARLDHEEALDATIAGWTVSFEAQALEELLRGVGVPVHRALDCSDIMDDPQLKTRDYIAYLEHPRLGSVPYERSRMRFSRTPATVKMAWPQIGEHNDYVLRELLGLNDEDITDLAIRNALE